MGTVVHDAMATAALGQAVLWDKWKELARERASIDAGIGEGSAMRTLEKRYIERFIAVFNQSAIRGKVHEELHCFVDSRLADQHRIGDTVNSFCAEGDGAIDENERFERVYNMSVTNFDRSDFHDLVLQGIEAGGLDVHAHKCNVRERDRKRGHNPRSSRKSGKVA